MEVITVRFQENVLKNMDKNIIAHKYNSRTEFIRDAVREKLDTLERKALEKEFLSFYGKSKKKTSDKELQEEHKKFSEEFLAELEKRFN